MTTDTFKQEAFAQESADPVLVLVTINHDDFSEPIRVVANNENITSRGNLFVAYPFELILPDSRDDSPPRARLSIDNVSREIAQSIRSISTAPNILIEVILASAVDTVEISWPHFSLRNVRWDASKVSGDLILEDFTEEPIPAHIFSPGYFPACF